MCRMCGTTGSRSNLSVISTEKSFIHAIFLMTKLLDMLEENEDVQNVWHNWQKD